jgi:hypothetical protein
MNNVLRFLSRAVSPAVIGDIAPVPSIAESLENTGDPNAAAEYYSQLMAPSARNSDATREARANLRDARAAVLEAEEELSKAIGITERIKQVIRDAADAAAALKAAEEAYVTATSEWAASGAQGDVVSPTIMARLETARISAHTAELAAKGARAALQQEVFQHDMEVDVLMSTQELNAREALDKATRKAAAAVGPVIMAHIEPDLRRAAALHAELMALMPRLFEFRRLCSQSGLNFSMTSSEFVDAFNTICSLPTYDAKRYDANEGRWAHWLYFGNALLKDPEATLVD